MLINKSEYRALRVLIKTWQIPNMKEAAIQGHMSLAATQLTSSGLLWAWLFGVLDGVESGTDVKILGLEKTSQPATFVGETHRQHECQGLHQTGVSLCRGRGWRSEVTSYNTTSQISRRSYLGAGEGTEQPL